MQPISVAHGDGIGPEIMEATLQILKAAGAKVKWEPIEMGEKEYLAGNSSGIGKEAWESIRRNKVVLKAPMTTPQGGGYKSLNVTLRKSLGLFANVRPCKSFHPFVPTKHPAMDLVVIRENEEDLYAGIEHQQTDEVVQCLKLITRPGCERIVRYAFEYARLYQRKKISCFTKDNIMKLTDGLFHRVFKEIAAEYPDIQAENWIIDIGAARLADTPEIFDVLVMPNLYGDVVSDITAQLSGSVGLAGSANIGEKCALFEAIHGSAPPLAGKDLANPSGLLRAAVMMLNHIGQPEVAETITNAWSCTLEEGIHTEDIYQAGLSKEKVGTRDFGKAVVERLGKKPATLAEVSYAKEARIHIAPYERKTPGEKTLHGVDLFIDWKGTNPDDLAEKIKDLHASFALKMITNRGVKVWPEGFEETFCTDHWRCRFELTSPNTKTTIGIAELLIHAIQKDIEVIKTENLYAFDGQKGYSLGQGQ
ncbi:NADP-dependent isocitrate dehydrogenase [Cyclobacterium xiamenense]|uniref:NADP-dependent isocitrate dehydrogenase n=1 Tax=Cyclobacterium xiamenense TaxID=1297121 RepID=UPI0012B8F05A|nr:NADP-dependent isocitrate dehydrogenase [Cyclobacterium xiamenense]